MSPQFKNPISFDSFTELLAAFLNVIIIIATPIVVFFLILAGFKYVTARGNPNQIQEASRALLYGVIGGVIIMGSVTILLIIKNLVDSF